MAIHIPCQAWIVSRGSGRPGCLGPAGRQVWGFCFPVPRSVTTMNSGEPLSQPPRLLTGSAGLIHFLLQKPVRGYLPLFPCQCPAAGVQSSAVVFPKVTEPALGQSQQTPPFPPPFLSAVWVTFPLLECQPGCALSLEPGAHTAAFLRLLGS